MRQQFYPNWWPAKWSQNLMALKDRVGVMFQRGLVFFYDTELPVWGRASMDWDSGGRRPLICVNPHKVGTAGADGETVLAHELYHIRQFAQGYIFERHHLSALSSLSPIGELCQKIVGLFVHRLMHPDIMTSGFARGEMKNLRIRWLQARDDVSDLLKGRVRFSVRGADAELARDIRKYLPSALFLDAAVLLADIVQRADANLSGEICEMTSTVKRSSSNSLLMTQGVSLFAPPNMWQYVSQLVETAQNAVPSNAQVKPEHILSAMNELLAATRFDQHTCFALVNTAPDK